MIAIQRPELAAEHLRKLVAQTPSSVEALNALGVAQDLLGDHGAAADTYRQALAVVPASTSVRNNLACRWPCRNGTGTPSISCVRWPRARCHPAGAPEPGPDLWPPGRQGAAERISRVDLGGQDLANNLAYFAAVRGIDAPTVGPRPFRPSRHGSTPSRG